MVRITQHRLKTQPTFSDARYAYYWVHIQSQSNPIISYIIPFPPFQRTRFDELNENTMCRDNKAEWCMDLVRLPFVLFFYSSLLLPRCCTVLRRAIGPSTASRCVPAYTIIPYSSTLLVLPSNPLEPLLLSRYTQRLTLLTTTIQDDRHLCRTSILIDPNSISRLPQLCQLRMKLRQISNKSMFLAQIGISPGCLLSSSTDSIYYASFHTVGAHFTHQNDSFKFLCLHEAAHIRYVLLAILHRLCLPHLTFDI